MSERPGKFRLVLFAAVFALPRCAKEEELSAFSLHRLLDPAASFDPASGVERRDAFSIGDETRPAVLLAPGAVFECRTTLPLQPCWLRFELARELAGGPPTRLVVRASDGVAERTLFDAQDDSISAGGEARFRSEHLDLAAFPSREIVLRFEVPVDAGSRAVLASPRIEAQEQFDTRFRTTVVVLLRSATMDALWAADDSLPFACLRLPSLAIPAAGRSPLLAFLGALGRAFQDADRECFGFWPSPPPVECGAFDVWFEGDALAARSPADPSYDAFRALATIFGVPRTSSILVVVGSDGEPPRVPEALDELRARLEGEGLLERATLCLLDLGIGSTGGARALVHTPQLAPVLTGGEDSPAAAALDLLGLARTLAEESLALSDRSAVRSRFLR